MTYVLIVIAWMVTSNPPQIATHDFANYSLCQQVALQMEKRFTQYHMKASCQAKGWNL